MVIFSSEVSGNSPDLQNISIKNIINNYSIKANYIGIEKYLFNNNFLGMESL